MKAKEVLKLLRIHRQTLYNYTKNGKLRFKTLPSGRLDYNDEDVFKLLGSVVERKNVLYCRVSTPSQKKDLENQQDTLTTFCAKNGITVQDIYKDIGSGINFDRKEFQRLVNDIVQYKVSKVYITYKDRMSRISFPLFSSLFKTFGTEIVVLNEIDDSKLIEKEIFNEIISLIHCFSMKVFSSRRKEKLELIQKDLELEVRE